MTAPTVADRPEPIEPPPSGETNRWLVLVIVCLAQFMVILDATIVNVALPSIQRDLGFSAGQPAVGHQRLHAGVRRLPAARRARRRPARAAERCSSWAWSSSPPPRCSTDSRRRRDWLVASRALQGLGGALVSPAALSIITTTFAEGEDRTKALGVWSAIAAGGGAFGLLLGGILTELLSWEWIFFVNVPIGIATLALALRYVPESRAPQRAGDRRRARRGDRHRRPDRARLRDRQGDGLRLGLVRRRSGSAAIAVALLAAFVCIETRSTRAADPARRSSASRSLAGANLVMLLVAGGLFAFFFFASLYVQQILGYSPLEAGLAFLPVTAGIVHRARDSRSSSSSASACARRVRARDGDRRVRAVHPVAGVRSAASYLSDVLPGLIPQSIGMGLTFVPITLIATTNVDEEDAGLASGLFNTSQQVGGALGLAVLSTLAANKTAERARGLGRASGPGATRAGRRLQRRVHGRRGPRRGRRAVLLLVLVRKQRRREREPEAAPVPSASPAARG